jgi:hypothetical protein
MATNATTRIMINTASVQITRAGMVQLACCLAILSDRSPTFGPVKILGFGQGRSRLVFIVEDAGLQAGQRPVPPVR